FEEDRRGGQRRRGVSHLCHSPSAKINHSAKQRSESEGPSTRMSYAGNPNLAPDIQKRILETFRHTLDVAARGGLEEARLGCDFVMQLDPQFAPAQALAERL